MSTKYRKTTTTNALPHVAETANKFRNVKVAVAVQIKAFKDRAELGWAVGAPGEAVHFTVNV